MLYYAEMWERFSYYGMRALLLLFMIAPLTMGGLGFDQKFAAQIYGNYTMASYMVCILGGYLADNFLGARRAVLIGGLIITAGHYCLAFASIPTFYAGLILIALGTGLLKPSISTLVGGLYSHGDARRDAGFSLFYMGINLGAFAAPLVIGWLAQSDQFKTLLTGWGFDPLHSWHWGFAAAGVGMLVGTVVYWMGSKHLPKHNQNVIKATAEEEQAGSSSWVRPLIVIGYLCFVNILFWGVFEQQGNALQVWADEKTNWSILGIDIPSSWFQVLNPFFIILLAPLLNRIWAKQRAKDKEPGSIVKMAIGCGWMAIAFLCMMFVASLAQGADKINVIWVASVVLLFTIGELYLSPIGQAMVSKVAPARMVSMFMGVWFLSSFFGNYLAGFIGSYYDKMSNQNYFAIMVVMSLIAVVMFVAPRKQLVKWLDQRV